MLTSPQMHHFYQPSAAARTALLGLFGGPVTLLEFVGVPNPVFGNIIKKRMLRKNKTKQKNKKFEV